MTIILACALVAIIPRKVLEFNSFFPTIWVNLTSLKMVAIVAIIPISSQTLSQRRTIVGLYSLRQLEAPIHKIHKIWKNLMGLVWLKMLSLRLENIKIQDHCEERRTVRVQMFFTTLCVFMVGGTLFCSAIVSLSDIMFVCFHLHGCVLCFVLWW